MPPSYVLTGPASSQAAGLRVRADDVFILPQTHSSEQQFQPHAIAARNFTPAYAKMRRWIHRLLSRASAGNSRGERRNHHKFFFAVVCGLQARGIPSELFIQGDPT